MAFISGMNNPSVLRLKWTLKLLPEKAKQIMTNLENLMSMNMSFKTYRAAIQQVQPPCIPYLGISLQDLTFVEENPDKFGNRINFSKQRIVHNIIVNMTKFQYLPYDISEDEEIKNFLTNLTRVEDAELWKISLQREPRNAGRADIR